MSKNTWQDRLQKYEGVRPSDDAWRRLEQKLERHRKRRRASHSWLGMAAGLLLLLAILYGVSYYSPSGIEARSANHFYLEELGNDFDDRYSPKVIRMAYESYAEVGFPAFGENN
jgi:hypothetical protein